MDKAKKSCPKQCGCGDDFIITGTRSGVAWKMKPSSCPWFRVLRAVSRVPRKDQNHDIGNGFETFSAGTLRKYNGQALDSAFQGANHQPLHLAKATES